ncbi:MAG TPA: hypothetical protein PKX20_02665 [Methanothrix soehngenii]|nr:hypothetical protein [Methanothrix soehngenii]
MKEFIDYWSAHHGQQDDGKALYDRYTRALADLDQSRRKTLKYIIPVNGSKGWHPVFDPNATDELVALASEIEAKNAALKSASQDIEEFMAAVGRPSLAMVGSELAVVKSRLADARAVAKAVSIKASNTHPGLSPAEVQELDDVVLANAAFAEVRGKLEPQIADLTDRITHGRALLLEEIPILRSG